MNFIFHQVVQLAMLIRSYGSSSLSFLIFTNLNNFVSATYFPLHCSSIFTSVLNTWNSTELKCRIFIYQYLCLCCFFLPSHGPVLFLSNQAVLCCLMLLCLLSQWFPPYPFLLRSWVMDTDRLYIYIRKHRLTLSIQKTFFFSPSTNCFKEIMRTFTFDPTTFLVTTLIKRLQNKIIFSLSR